MRRSLSFAVLCLAALLFATAAARAETHVVGPGHTLAKIAKRYHVTIEALCEANKVNRRDPLKLGQTLVIPEASEARDDIKDDQETDKAAASGKTEKPAESEDSDEEPSTRSYGSDGLRALSVPGQQEAYYYEPIGPGRKGMKPVVMYLHGRGGRPVQDCRRWAPIARRLGWLVCPSGPTAHGDGRDWNNNWASGQQISVATLKALRKKYGRRVQLAGNTLIGFSEGAYVALNVGVREPQTFNRWLILAGNTSYWGGAGLEELKKNAAQLKRVYLITGEQDSVIDGTDQLREWLERYRVATRLTTPSDMGHEVALERKANIYRAALAWLDRGVGTQGRISKKPSAKNQDESTRKRH